MSNKVTHVVYSHHHADHVGASSLFGRHVVRVGHAETKRLLARDNDPPRPVPLPDVTFETHRTLRVGGERIDLAWHGTNHTPDNIYIHFPDHDTLMLVDILLPGWAPYNSFNVNEDVPGSIAAPAKAMAYPWKHFIGGHMGRLGTRDDMVVYQQYVSDLIDNIKKALVAVDPTPFFVRYGNNSWAAVKAYQDAQVELRGRAGHREVHRRPRGRRRLHRQHRVPPPRVDPPRPRLRLADPPLDDAGAAPAVGGRTSDPPNAAAGPPQVPVGASHGVVRRSRPPRRVGGRPRGPERVDLVGQMLDLEGEDDPRARAGPDVGQMITTAPVRDREQAGEDVRTAHARVGAARQRLRDTLDDEQHAQERAQAAERSSRC